MICSARFGHCDVVAIEAHGFSWRVALHPFALYSLMYCNNPYSEFSVGSVFYCSFFWYLVCVQKCDAAIQDWTEQLFLETDNSYQATPCSRFPNSRASSLALILFVWGQSLRDMHHPFFTASSTHLCSPIWTHVIMLVWGLTTDK